ncbi:hypothetical protein D2A34_21930 [Clostridium chromiireducens]|uniref:Uncharacterized protein n=1 Tax=Clostridium chromiireducens TaxID=225345 RepID=A0A399IK36_9CLOT|nr:hypothetical protein [Clostridium chromiireducens]RII32857.1 hypothetical protein D2A34_21930 [Clostridium chromiireducens]
MEYIIDTSNGVNLNWSAKGKDRIAQNVLNLISTFKYEVAYNREKGISPAILDKPVNIMQAAYIAEVYRVVQKDEPRAVVKSVSLLGVDEEGDAKFKVVIDI